MSNAIENTSSTYGTNSAHPCSVTLLIHVYKRGIIVRYFNFFLAYAIFFQSLLHTSPSVKAQDIALENVVKEALESDFLSLTPEEIEERDKRLQPIYDNFQENNVGKVYQKMTEVYGLNFYHNYESHKLDSKEGILNAVGLYFLDKKVSSLSNVSNKVLPKLQNLSLNQNYHHSIPCREVKKNKKKKDAGKFVYKDQPMDCSVDFLFDVYTRKQEKELFYGSGDFFLSWTKKTVKTPMGAKLFEIPEVLELLEGFKLSEIKALDANIFVSTSDLKKDGEVVAYEVIYPEFSPLAPVPSPIVYISKNASRYHIQEMLKIHGPLIYAYNKLFDEKVIPQVMEINGSFANFSGLPTEVQDLAKKYGKQNTRKAMFKAFLAVNYAIMAGTLAAGFGYLTWKAFTTPGVYVGTGYQNLGPVINYYVF